MSLRGHCFVIPYLVSSFGTNDIPDADKTGNKPACQYIEGMCCHEQRLALGLPWEDFYKKNPCECHPLCRCARFGCDRCAERPLHLDHYVCFPCRKYGKRGVKEGDVQADGIIPEDGKRCPQCKNPMIPVGVD